MIELTDGSYAACQKELIWFDENNKNEVPTDEWKLYEISSDNPNNPFNDFISNQNAVKRLKRAVYTALGRYNRCCNDQNFAFLGPPSTGKTTLAKKFADAVGLPFVEVSPVSIKKAKDLLVQISRVCEQTKGMYEEYLEYTLELVPIDGGKFVLPPIIVFIDEVHALSDTMVKALLKATEQDDRMFVTENNWIVDCRNVCWIIATTERGQLFDAFDTRFTKIHLNPYTRKEISLIINKKYPHWEESVCDLITHYCHSSPREALAFSKEVALELAMDSSNPEEVVRRIAEENEIDKFGMTKQRLNLLKILKENKAVSKSRLSQMLSCKDEELEKYIIPPLIISVDEPSLIKVDNKGYSLTEYGEDYLVKRGLL